MHIATPTALIVTAFVASLVLVMQRGDRLAPGVAVIASGLQALIVLGIVSISVARFRIDLILASLLFAAAAICWSRSSTKSAVTASTIAAAVGLLQVLDAIGFLR
jgi:hypothetical protein